MVETSEEELVAAHPEGICSADDATDRVPEESKMTSVEPLASNLVDLRDSGVAPWRKDGGGTDSEALDWFAKDKAKSYGLKSLPVVPAA